VFLSDFSLFFPIIYTKPSKFEYLSENQGVLYVYMYLCRVVLHFQTTIQI